MLCMFPASCSPAARLIVLPHSSTLVDSCEHLGRMREDVRVDTFDNHEKMRVGNVLEDERKLIANWKHLRMMRES